MKSTKIIEIFEAVLLLFRTISRLCIFNILKFCPTTPDLKHNFCLHASCSACFYCVASFTGKLHSVPRMQRTTQSRRDRAGTNQEVTHLFFSTPWGWVYLHTPLLTSFFFIWSDTPWGCLRGGVRPLIFGKKLILEETKSKIRNVNNFSCNFRPR